MTRQKPVNLSLERIDCRTGSSRTKSWFIGTPVIVRKHSRSKELTDKKGWVVGRDRFRPRWLLCNFKDGSIGWYHVDMLFK